jgi:outer membrane protein W
MKKIIIASIIFLSAASGYAQQDFIAGGWEINFPNNSNYLTKTSFAGGKIDYRHFIKKNFSLGLAINWATYEQYIPRQTFVKPDGNSAVTSDYVAQSYQLPFTVTAHYYFKETKLLKPYAGVAMGGQYLGQSLYYNVYESDNYNWGFVVRPELGVIIKPSDYEKWGILVAVNYSYATNKTDLLNLKSFQNFGITIGVAYW